MTVSSAAIWLNTVFANFDLSICLAVHQLYELAGGFFTPFFKFVSLFGKQLVPLILLPLLFFKKTRRFGVAMTFGMLAGVLITNCCLKIVIARPRPYADTSSTFYQLWLTVGQAMESDNSFPSGHTCAAFSMMTAAFLVGDRRKSWVFFIFAVLVGISRIYLVVHYATDVIAGMIVGIAAGAIGYFIYTKLPDVIYSFEFIKPQQGKHLKQ